MNTLLRRSWKGFRVFDNGSKLFECLGRMEWWFGMKVARVWYSIILDSGMYRSARRTGDYRLEASVIKMMKMKMLVILREMMR